MQLRDFSSLIGLTGFALGFISVSGTAQTNSQSTARLVDTMITLSTDVEVLAQRYRHRPIGSTGQSWTGSELSNARTVAELLDRGAGIHVRNYGPSSLASVSVRGGSAAHTLAIWNGLPLSNPSHGQLDWSLLSLSSLAPQRLSLTRGGNSAAWGSGAVSATVSIDDVDNLQLGSQIQLGSTLGAFGELEAQARLAYGHRRWSTSTRFQTRSADNDFSFRPAPSLPAQKQINSALEQIDLRQDFYAYLRPGESLSLHYWHQSVDRQIPPTLLQRRSLANQTDEANRLSFRYRRAGETVSFQATAGYLAERLHFLDPLLGQDSRSRSTVLIADATLSYPLARHQELQFTATGTHTQAQVDNAYAGHPQEKSLSGLISYRANLGNWQVQTMARYGRAAGHSLGFTPSVGLEYQLSPQLRARLRAGRDYRAPTFNDRYYQPGGNPDLRPEVGWSAESGLDWQHGAWQASLTGFHRDVNDWLLWARVNTQPFFSAYNLAHVTSTGLEPRLAFAKTYALHWQVQLQGGYDFVRAINREAIEVPHIQQGQALFYVPRNSSFAKAQISYRHFELQLIHRWRGKNLGINAELPSSHSADAMLGFRQNSARLSWQAFVELRNFTDQGYQLIENRPLPGRHARIGLIVDFQIRKPQPALEP